MQVIAADVGNSSTRIAIKNADDSQWNQVAVVRDDLELNEVLGDIDFDGEPMFWAVSSVCPDRLERLSHWTTQNRPADRFHVVTSEDVDLESNVESRQLLGRDRLIAAWMAVELNGTKGPVVVVDAGTAVTIDWVDDQLVFQGGFIFPGADLNFRQLSDRTAALPDLHRNHRIEWLMSTKSEQQKSEQQVASNSEIGRLLGQSTESAIVRGVYLSQIASIAGIVNQLTAGQADSVSVYLTGGGIAEILEFSTVLSNPFPGSWNLVPDLVLQGTYGIGHRIHHQHRL